MLMAHLLELIWATSTPGTMRNRSGMLFAPDRAMSSAVMTKTAEAVFDIFCSFLETEVTSMFIRSSRFKFVRSCGDAWPAQTSQRTANMISHKSDLRLFLMSDSTVPSLRFLTDEVTVTVTATSVGYEMSVRDRKSTRLNSSH